MELRDMLTMVAILIAIVAGPLSAMIISLKIIAPRQEKRKRKIDLFFTLLQKRKKFQEKNDQEIFVDALNIIDVVFYGEKKIMEAKKELLKSNNTIPLQFEDYDKRLLDLLTEMGKTLGYKEIKPSDFATPFMLPVIDSNVSKIVSNA